MTNRFEELEEQLKQLDTIPLVSAGIQGPAPASQEIPAASAPATIPIAIHNFNENEEAPQQSRLRDECKSVEPEPKQPVAASGLLARVGSAVFGLFGWRSSTRLRALEDRALAECQERMREVVGSVIEDARRQLEALTNELLPSLQVRLEKSTENSVKEVSSQFAEQLEHQVQAATLRAVAIAPTLQSGEPVETIGGWRNNRASAEVDQLADAESLQAQLTQAFTPVVKEIELKSAAFLDHLNLQLHGTLRAFGEKATKHAAEEFGRIAVEVLKAEVGRLQTPSNGCRMAAGIIGSAPPTPSRNVAKLDRERQAMPALQSVPHERMTVAQPPSGAAVPKNKSCGARSGSAEKVRTGAPNWRILGLG
jgi:hypothetical protein